MRSEKFAGTTKLMMEAPKESLTTQKILERRKRFQKTGNFAAAKQQPSSQAPSGAGARTEVASAASATAGFTKEQLAKREKLLAMIAKNKASSGSEGGRGAAAKKPQASHSGFGWRNAWTPGKEQAKQALSDSLPKTP